MITRRAKPPAAIRLLPSVVTILALCSGLSAVKFALDGQLGTALAMIGAAAILDALDGRIARLLDATSKIGAELDSLSDAISFGVAPALVLYVTLLEGSSGGWIVALVYAVSIVLRLARFNTLLDEDDTPAYAREYFTGVPAPAGALIAMAPIAGFEQFGDGWWASFYVVAGWAILTAGLIVSRIPTLALKTVSVPPRLAAILLVLVALLAAALITFPLILLMGLVLAYLVHIPFAVRSQRWTAARPYTWDAKPAERRAERRAIRRAPGNARRSQARLGLRRPRS
ncbi:MULTISPECIES: CDP-diacylglycerol--serine O-phosphatidyltransferase [unclassified Rhodococcus (in: high G+C Gram-positive bacteria)]|uniref:CDP-diacylglycerol--serine O-phosphatidyltransferase n=1 Tax=unclassified Rhodococcus (in: high G+C Gram-positive bacteria) TaxID=192944 RepID=UPI0007BBCF7D|nr:MULTISPECIES: CDP-diacylglycerol--serine O-phosphatidyltransferase [unclassified Rhodococcus (in: high G+C Gram-positive bacteria)]KZF08248.1 CDP-diacylglycerol--serine O-phosphatidyltransferase [Rhodococcus sp. EPR-147]KZF09785.1 CDP-diacylglycerol--serine O-phosphatidyltransferase [Rhodococcus sp. EPR-279]MDI6629564.1 CDP-diacylglycerol--serine O-phosphatidyltransferase [Rhodococcus sp. (in: high G+C Gram-positive bacteria)]OZF46729.1 CDP-diacylglycerol--serine O-phosphatidyltransferase [R